jgi:hypothetical protein
MAKVLPNGSVISNDNCWLWDGVAWIVLDASSASKKPDRVQTDHARTLARTSTAEEQQAFADEVLDDIRVSGSLAGARKLLAERYEERAAGEQSGKETEQWVEVEIDAEIEVKTYKSPKDFESDSKEMIRKGWQPKNQSALAGHMNVGRTLGKAALTGGLGLVLTGASRNKDQLTVTWSRRRTERRRLVRESEADNPPASEASAGPSVDDIATRISQLAELHGQGILTDEEFANKKAELLARM